MSTLREAAQQALEALENGKRVRDGEGGTKYQPPLEDSAITALRAALAQQEQEPVAWVEKDGELVWCDKARATGRNLYIRPPRREWRGLKEGEIQTIVNKVAIGTYQTSDTFARAIEAKLKEKNHD